MRFSIWVVLTLFTNTHASLASSNLERQNECTGATTDELIFKTDIEALARLARPENPLVSIGHPMTVPWLLICQRDLILSRAADDMILVIGMSARRTGWQTPWGKELIMCLKGICTMNVGGKADFHKFGDVSCAWQLRKYITGRSFYVEMETASTSAYTTVGTHCWFHSLLKFMR